MADSYNEIFGLGSHSEDANLEVLLLGQDNAASTTVADQSSNGRDGTLEGGDNTADIAASGPNGWLTSALDLDGAADRIAIPPAACVSGSAERSYFIFVSADSFDTALTQSFLDFGDADGAGAGQAFVVAAEDQAISVAMYLHRTITPKTTLNTSTFYAIGIRVPSGATGTQDVDVLINGTNQTLSSEAGSNQTLNTTLEATHYIGYQAADDVYFDGQWAHLANFSRALTDAEFSEIGNGPEPINVVAPALSGTETEGETLSSTTGTWVLPSPFASGSNGTITYAYQWTRSNDAGGSGEADIAGETGSTYTLQAADVGKFIRCRVAASNDGGNDSAADTNSDMSGAIAAAAGAVGRGLIHSLKLGRPQLVG